MEETIIIPAMGMKWQLGMKYDARKQQIVHGPCPWKSDTMDAGKKVVVSPSCNTQIEIVNSINSMSNLFDLDVNLSVGFLGGLVQVDGAAKFLEERVSKSISERVVHSCNFGTHYEKLSPNLQRATAVEHPDALEDEECTHICIQIEYGAGYCLMFERDLDELSSDKKIEGSLHVLVKSIPSFQIDGSGKVDIAENEKKISEKVRVKYFGDISPTQPIISFEDACIAIRELQKPPTNSVPMKVHLLPVCKLSSKFSRVVHTLQEESLQETLDLMKTFAVVLARIEELHSYEPLIKFSSFGDMLNVVEVKLKSAQAKLKLLISETIPAIRRGKQTEEESLIPILDKYYGSAFAPEFLKRWIKEQEEKIRFFRLTFHRLKDTAKVVENSAELAVDISTAIQDSSCTLVLNIKVGNQLNDVLYQSMESWNPTDGNLPIPEQIGVERLDIKERLYQEIASFVRFVNVNRKEDVSPKVLMMAGEDQSSRSGDISASITLHRKTGVKVVNFVPPDSPEELRTISVADKCALFQWEPPIVGIEFLTAFELQFQKIDSKTQETADWTKVFFYPGGDSDNVRKVDGLDPSTTYCFRLRSVCEAGGSEWSETVTLQTCRPVEEEPYNIVLCGATGVGKSTFINSFLNYLSFDSLDSAKSNLRILMPASFIVFDSNGVEQRVQVIPREVAVTDQTQQGPEDLTATAKGGSCTQRCQPYLFSVSEGCVEYKVRIIDTPGIGDTRGQEQDKKNIQCILDALGTYAKIHALVFMLKPNEARLTSYFEFYMYELFKMLHVDASRNILFVMTNSRATGYTPGDTMVPLRKILARLKDEAPHVDVQANISGPNKTIFCLDSESFRYLAQLQNGISSEARDDDYKKSWERSTDTCRELFLRIRSLDPHQSKQTTSLNAARQIVLALAEPLAIIRTNIEERVEKIMLDRKFISEKQGLLTTLEQKKIFQRPQLESFAVEPQTVCTNQNCIEVLSSDGGDRIIGWKRPCHDRCYVPNVVPGQHPDPQLMNCSAIMSDGKCQVCHHSWEDHKHTIVNYKTKMVDTVDPEVQEKISTATDAINQRLSLLKTWEKEMNEIQSERDVINKAAASFALFCSHSGISPINVAFDKYIMLEIEKKRGEVNRFRQDFGGEHERTKAAALTLERLETELEKYNEEVKIYKEALKSADIHGRDGSVKTPDEVVALQKKLFQLPIFGKTIEQVFNQGVSSREKYSSGLGDHVAYAQPPRIVTGQAGSTRSRRPRSAAGAGGSDGGGWKWKIFPTNWNPFCRC